MRKAIELGCSTVTRSRVVRCGRSCAGTREPGELLARARLEPLAVAATRPCPRRQTTPPRAPGPRAIPISGRPALISATETAQPLAPADEIARAVDRIDQPDQALVEPLGIVGGFFRQPAAAGSSALSSRRRKASTSRSASHTGLPGVFSQLCRSWPAPRPLANARSARPRGRSLRVRYCRSSVRCACAPVPEPHFSSARNACLCARKPPSSDLIIDNEGSRPMNIHEYQAKELLAKFGIARARPAIPR